jgi:small subunit ribosomal protein S8
MYIQLLNKIKNAQGIGQQSIRYPHSKMDEAILEVLAKAGFIRGFEKKGKNPKKYFEIELSYKNDRGAIRGIQYLSKPSRRLYSGAEGIRSVKQGYGISVLSTSAGIMSGTDAKQKNVGGQLLFNIW